MAQSQSRIKLVVWIAVAIAIIAVARFLHAESYLERVLRWTASLGPLGAIVFIAIYILACVLFIPGAILTIGAGVVFGVIRGSIYVSIAATLGATCAFLIGRYVARDWVAAKLESNPRFKAIDDAVAREGWKIVGLTRLSPVFPFNLLNYAFGLTRVSLRDYVAASWIGMLPGTVMYVYIGSLAGDVARAAGARGAQPPARWALNVVGFAATVAVAIYVARIGNRALREKTS